MRSREADKENQKESACQISYSVGVRNLGISRGVQSTPSLNNISKMVPLSQVVMRMAVGMRLKWSSCNSFASGNLKSKILLMFLKDVHMVAFGIEEMVISVRE